MIYRHEKFLQVRPSPIYPYPFPKNCGSPVPCNCLSPRTRLSHYRNQTRRRRDVGDKLYLLGCHPIKGSLHSTAYTAPGLVLPSRVNTLWIYSGGTCFSVSIIPLQVWLVLISMSRFWATCCNKRNQMVFGYQIYRVSIRFHAIQTNTVIFGILFLTRYRIFVTRKNYTSYWVNLTPWL